MIWIVSILIYLLIGFGVLWWAAKQDAMVLCFWWLVVLFYPVLFIQSWFRN